MSNESLDLKLTVLDVADTLSCEVYGELSAESDLRRVAIKHVAISTKEVREGSLFVALQGNNSHGLEHASEAFSNGASAILIGTDLELDEDRWQELLSTASNIGTVLVATDCDGVTVLGRLARMHRRRSRFKVIGITGSSGKTSTKDILKALLEKAGVSVVASHANWNNEIGVPLTLLSASPVDTDIVICEMGMRGAGQISWLCDISDPDIGVVTTVGTSHLELLGSEAAIMSAKAELLSGTWQGGVGVFPSAQEEIIEAAERSPDRLLPFGVGQDEAEMSVVLVENIERTTEGIHGSIDIAGTKRAWSLPIYGAHQARNFAAAVAALVAALGPIELLEDDCLLITSAQKHLFTGGRGQRHSLGEGGIVIDDAYNANPESVLAALIELSSTALYTEGSRRIAVLGKMAELGKTSPKIHCVIGERAASMNEIDTLVAVGVGKEIEGLIKGWKKQRNSDTVLAIESVDLAIETILEWSAAKDTLLVKASNSVGLSRLVAAIVERHK